MQFVFWQIAHMRAMCVRPEYWNVRCACVRPKNPSQLTVWLNSNDMKWLLVHKKLYSFWFETNCGSKSKYLLSIPKQTKVIFVISSHEIIDKDQHFQLPNWGHTNMHTHTIALLVHYWSLTKKLDCWCEISQLWARQSRGCRGTMAVTPDFFSQGAWGQIMPTILLYAPRIFIPSYSPELDDEGREAWRLYMETRGLAR